MSSATQTERAGNGASADRSDGQPADSSAAPGLPVSPGVLVWGGGLLVLLGGWLSILHVYRWHFTAPVFFLFTGWLAIVLTARFLWRAGLVAADDTGMADDEFWKPVGPHDELLREKRALLKAIKEIEFDHQMGKMSEEDATQLTRFYRLRAIEIIKALESEGEGEELSMQEQIEREVKARLAVSQKARKKKGKQRPADAAAGKAEAKPEGEDEAKDQAEAKPEGEDEGAAGSKEEVAS